MLVALAGSFAVYLVPLVGPHAAWPVALHLAQLAGRRDAVHLVLALAAVLATQCALGAALFVTRRAGWIARGVVLAVVGPVLAVALNAALLVGVPTLALIETDPRPDAGTLPEACVVPGYGLSNVRSPLALAEAGEALLQPASEATFALLRTPACTTHPTSIPVAATHVSLRPAGRALFALWRAAEDRYDWFLAEGGDSPARPLSIPQWTRRLPGPVLLADGEHVAWIEPRLTERGSAVTEPPFAFLCVQNLERAGTRRVALDVAERGSYRLLDGEGPAGPFRLIRELHERVFLDVDGEGRVLGELRPQPGASPMEWHDGYVLTARGWLGWDVYAEGRRYVIAWDLPAGRGRFDVARGSGITSAALDPGGRFVAYSTTTNLNIGSVPDSVVLARTDDGAEVFRRRLPRHARAEVALLGRSAFFAWTDSTGAPPRVRIHRLP